MSQPVRLDDDDRRLVARLVDAAGVHPAARTLDRYDVEGIVVTARDIGKCIAVSQMAGFRHCRVCGCTDLITCKPEPCGWAEADLCTACADMPATEG